jgi:hypothetical protein
VNHRHFRHRGEQHLAVGQLAILGDPDQKVRVGRPRHCKLLVDIAFAVLNMGDVHGLFEYLVGRLNALQPAIGFLLFDRAPVVIDRGALVAHIDLRPDQPQTMTIFTVNRQGRMQEQAYVGAVSNRAQAASAAGMTLIVQFGGVRLSSGGACHASTAYCRGNCNAGSALNTRQLPGFELMSETHPGYSRTAISCMS